MAGAARRRLWRPCPGTERTRIRRYLECGILAHGFAQARCPDCGHHFIVAYSRKGRGICPSCTTRRMVETAAHLTDHVFLRLPVRLWVLSLPKGLRYHLDDVNLKNAVLHSLLHGIEQGLRESLSETDGATHTYAQPHTRINTPIGAVVFIHRFGDLLNAHLALHSLRSHFHVLMIDGVFCEEEARHLHFQEVGYSAICGNHKRSRSRFLLRMTEFVDTPGLCVRLIYYPKYHSKYNAIERYWAGLEKSWNSYLLSTVHRAENFLLKSVHGGAFAGCQL